MQFNALMYVCDDANECICIKIYFLTKSARKTPTYFFIFFFIFDLFNLLPRGVKPETTRCYSDALTTRPEALSLHESI
jgi:hypothetical protein